MIADVHEPLGQYVSEFQESHRKNTAEFFENLVKQSSVDEEANAKTVEQLRAIEEKAASAGSANKWWRFLRGATIVATLLGAAYVFLHYPWPWLIPLAAVPLPALYWLNKTIKQSDARLQALRQACDEKRAEAWGQMAPLNSLFDWDIQATLIQKTVPRLALDRYFFQWPHGPAAPAFWLVG
nr:hypothetical protein [uncultured Herbaspirillum sp.]